MATKTIAWTTGSGNITLTYTGQGNGSVSVSSSENDIFDDRSQTFNIVTTNGTPEQAISILVKQKGKSYPIGEVFNFAYTGSVQQITLPKGKYKLQCWGAQGGGSYYSNSIYGSKGGYSEGVLTLNKTTTLYIFVGGQGSRSSSTSLANGGWNGGGASVGFSSYESGGTRGESYPGSGGGATDICTVTSSMSYSSGVTNRSYLSRMSRFIVAGGGGGASAFWKRETVEDTYTNYIIDYSGSPKTQFDWEGEKYAECTFDVSSYAGQSVTFRNSGSYATLSITIHNSSGSWLDGSNNANKSSLTWTKTLPSGVSYVKFQCKSKTSSYPSSMTCEGYVTEVTSYDDVTSEKSNGSQQGGGTSGKGKYPGTQTQGGNGNGNDGSFGFGGSQTFTNYRYASGGGGGGWYGGGTAISDSSTSYINYSGGGSGYVNTPGAAGSSLDDYTGLLLDSGSTTAGSSSFPSTSGGTETGHSGNGYARITVIE